MNATALTQNSKAVTDGIFGAMQSFGDELRCFVTCHGEKDSVVIFDPRLSSTLPGFLRALPNQSEFGGPGPNRVRLPAEMPPKKFAHRCSLPIPPFLITFSKDLVVFWSPGCVLIGVPIRRVFELANLSPQFGSREARLVLQYSFDRVVRTGSATFYPFAQNPVDLFRREKPESIVARRTGPTICHETTPCRICSKDRLLWRMFNPCQPRMVFGSVFPEAA